ncbi:UNKNOWN [Stylonychia lemnae]|uniref:Uncharacterized protein n=1 Tax=Stylonychia lemnae TaxID=5949 RepID=A0A078AR37_STYLE|nr:UNKNOWN [Stylonychia lemnae]|eukprot:CDW83343.1 UNKNOWN [Stylonychia lemnae]
MTQSSADIPDIQELTLENGVTPAMKQVHLNTLSKIQPDSWFNIPVCVVRAFKSMIENCQNQNQIIKEMNERTNEREKIVYGALKKIETSLIDKDNDLHRAMDQMERQILDKLRKFQIDVETQISVQDQRLREMYNNSFEDREFLYNKLSGVEDSSIIRSYIEEQLIQMEHRFRKQQFDYRSEIDSVFAGHGENFENLRGWVSYMNTYVQHNMVEMEIKIQDKTLSEVKKQINKMSQVLDQNKDHLMNQITISGEQLSNIVETKVNQVSQENVDKLNEVKKEQNTVQNNVKFLEKRIEGIKSDLNLLKIDDSNLTLIDQLKEQLRQDISVSSDKQKQKIKKVKLSLKDREDGLKKKIDQLQTEIRATTSKKETGKATLELTDKIKRQIQEMILANIEKQINSSVSKQNTNANSILGGGSHQQSNNNITIASRNGNNLSETTTSKFKHSMTQKRDANGNLLNINNLDTEQQISSKSSFNQKQQKQQLIQQQNHGRAKSTLENYDQNGLMNIEPFDENAILKSEDKTLNQLTQNNNFMNDKLIQLNSTQVELLSGQQSQSYHHRQRTIFKQEQSEIPALANDYTPSTQQQRKRQMILNKTIGSQNQDGDENNQTFRRNNYTEMNILESRERTMDPSFRGEMATINASDTSYFRQSREGATRFKTNESNSSLQPNKTQNQTIQNIKILNQTNTKKIIFSQKPQNQKNQVRPIAVKFEAL